MLTPWIENLQKQRQTYVAKEDAAAEGDKSSLTLKVQSTVKNLKAVAHKTLA